MNSLIFASRNCSKCNERPFEPSERMVLKTATRDICCTCGSVLQTFPELTGITTPKDLISIPPAVSAVLEKLLTRRLFILGRGQQPSRVMARNLDVERMAKTLVHRVGDQVLLDLRGPGNCVGEIRWNYSSGELLPRHPWEEPEYLGGHRNSRRELKPRLQDVEFPLPPRIVRACDAIDGFDLVSSLLNRDDRCQRSLRFEKRVPVTEKFLDTTESLVLVVKVEFGWLQVGSSFPSEEGPREFNTSCHYQGYPQSLEEAVDDAIHMMMTRRQEAGHAEIYHSSDRLAKLAEVKNPLDAEPRKQYYMSCRPVAKHSSHIETRQDARFRGAYDAGNGVFLVPEDLDYHLSVSMPQDRRYQEEHILPDVQVVVKHGEEVIVERTFGGPSCDTGHGAFGYSVVYTVSSDKLKKLNAGDTLTTVITDNGAAVERVYKVVPLKQYDAAWDDLQNAIIEPYKRTVIAAVTSMMRNYWRTRDDAQMPFELKSGQKAAAFIEGRWLEGVYEGTVDGERVVNVVTVTGRTAYNVSQVLPLEVALTEGLHVVPPFNSRNGTGSNAARREKSADKRLTA
jgi:hypothetical protein